MMYLLFDTIAWVKRLFCRHEYEEEFLAGFLVVDGWLIQARQLKCRKCGKTKKWRNHT